MSHSRVSRRFAALLLAAALLAMPAVAGAAPVSTDSAAGSWSSFLEDLTGLFASWFHLGGDDAARATGESDADLGSTLDPDGFRMPVPDQDPTRTATSDSNQPADLGSTLDPDG